MPDSPKLPKSGIESQKQKLTADQNTDERGLRGVNPG
jgi:hypothetical protein